MNGGSPTQKTDKCHIFLLELLYNSMHVFNLNHEIDYILKLTNTRRKTMFDEMDFDSSYSNNNEDIYSNTVLEKELEINERRMKIRKSLDKILEQRRIKEETDFL